MDIKTTKLLRGIALLMVLGSHYSLWMFNECFHPQMREFAMTWGVYGVDIFFMVSAYGLVKSTHEKGIDGGFVIKRLFGVYIPYLLVVVACYWMDNGIPKGNDLRKLLTGYDYWYMNVQFAFYIIFAICYILPKYRKSAITVSAVAYSYCLWAQGRNDFWILSNMAFLLGIYLAEAEYKWEGIWRKPLGRILLPVAGAIGTAVFGYIYYANGGLKYQMILSIFFTVLVAGIGINIRGFGVVLCSLGTYSLYIYVLHTRFFWKFVMYNEQWTYFQRTLLAFALTCIICIPLGFIMDNVMKKIREKMFNIGVSK